MIEIHLPSKREVALIPLKSPTQTHPPWGSENKDEDKASNTGNNPAFIFEKLRRDKIIKDMYSKCKWKPGDFVMPHSEPERHRFGRKCRVSAVARNLIEFGENDWPKNDQPMIVSVHIEDTNKNFFCTPEYLVPYEACAEQSKSTA